MRLFWAVVGVLMVAASAFLVMSKGREATGTAQPVEPAPQTPPIAAMPEPKPGPPAATPPPRQESTPAAAQPAAQPAAAKTEPPAPAQPQPPQPTQPVAAAPERPAEGTPPPAPTAAIPSPNFLESLKPPPAPPAAQTPPPAAAPAKIESQADGSLLVDGKFAVKGKGTQDDPYKVTWDHLVSAQEDYVPRTGRTELPGRITMLADKWVEITGNIAFPVMAETQEDCLSMMNQWDGCCIGIPPTPYDAVEVRLKIAVEGNNRLTTYGVVRGRFKVEPQLVGGWLIGLYVMDDATLTPQTYGGFAP